MVYHKSAEISVNKVTDTLMNVIIEWMEGWGDLIVVDIKRSYTVALNEELTPLPKSHDSNDVIMLDGISLGQALSVFRRA